MTTRPGDRIRIVELGLGDPTLRPGDEFEVEFVSSEGHMLVLKGTNAALIATLGDRWELVEEKAA